MTTFDLVEVRGFAADLDARMDRCDDGEGMACATLDAALRHYADLCCKLRDGVREWGQAVFAGRVAFDPEVERVWQTEGRRLFTRSVGMYVSAQRAEGPCYVLDGQAALGSALWNLQLLLDRWVSPRLAVGPSARLGAGTDPVVIKEARRRVQALPPLPADWEPDDPHQKARYRRLRPH